MTVKARIASIRLTEKINQRPAYAEQIGLSANSLGSANDDKQQKKKHER